MNNKNIERTSNISLIFTPILILTYTYCIGVMKYGDKISTSPIDSILSQYTLALHQSAPFLTAIIAAAILTCGAVLNVMLTTRYNLFMKETQIPLLLYVCFVVGFTASSDMLSAAIASCVGIFSLRDFFRTYENSGRTSKLFTACFWMGILPMIYPSTIVLWIAAFCFFILFVRSFYELSVVILGLLLPIFTFVYIGWLFGADIKLQIAEFVGSIVSNYPQLSSIWSYPMIFSTVLTTIIVLLAIFTLLQLKLISIRFVVRTRLYCALILTTLGGVMMLLPSFSVDSLVPLAAPLSIAVAPALMRMRSGITIPILVLIITLAASSSISLLRV